MWRCPGAHRPPACMVRFFALFAPEESVESSEVHVVSHVLLRAVPLIISHLYTERLACSQWRSVLTVLAVRVSAINEDGEFSRHDLFPTSCGEKFCPGCSVGPRTS